MKPKYTNIRIRLGDLVAWGENPKFSTKTQAKRLIESEREFGQPQPFTVSPYLEDGKRANCYDGHQRMAAWNTVYGADFVVDARQSDRHFTDEERRKFALLMHTATGSLDWNALSSWDTESVRDWVGGEEKLHEWNNDALNLREMMVAEIDEAVAFGKLPDEDRAPFQQMTFTLHDEQAETVREAIKAAKALGAFVDTGNENSNGNALARICEFFIGEHGDSERN